jgi:multisite-specific tRNA:(cytosine-C5)-methyltransferase
LALCNALTIQQIICNNDWSRLRLVSAGVKAFVRQDSHSSVDKECKWRIPAEGISGLLPHMDHSVIANATVKDLKVLLTDLYPVVGIGPTIIVKLD